MKQIKSHCLCYGDCLFCTRRKKTRKSQGCLSVNYPVRVMSRLVRKMISMRQNTSIITSGGSFHALIRGELIKVGKIPKSEYCRIFAYAIRRFKSEVIVHNGGVNHGHLNKKIRVNDRPRRFRVDVFEMNGHKKVGSVLFVRVEEIKNR